MREHAVIEASGSAKHPAVARWGMGRIAVEAVTLAVLALPPVWLAMHWPQILVSPHLHHGRMSLWLMPAYAVAVYLMLSEFGLLSKMGILRKGHRLSGMRPTFLSYFLTVRVELLAFIAGLSLAIDHSAITGRVWADKDFLAAFAIVIAFTIVLFTRAGYRLARRGA